MKPRIEVVFGTRPEAIKLAPVILELRRRASVGCRVCVTAQHRQMLDQVLEVFGIQPDVDLDLMRRDQSLAELTGRLLERLDAQFATDCPDLVLVQGDTTTALCAALAAFYRRIPVGHVEAGLRTWDLDAPWPEEANRVLTSRLASLHFAPTAWARRNLTREGVAGARVWVTGNTVVDALGIALKRVRRVPPRIAALPEALQPRRSGGSPRLDGPRLVLITGHRRESFGGGFNEICHAIAELAARHPDVHFIYPVHLNPNVREPVRRILATGPRRSGAVLANVHLIDPLSYLEFVALMNRACLVLTDSGGIQEEAPSLGKPVLLMRDTTERPEAVEAGVVRLVGTVRRRIVREVARLLEDPDAYEAMAGCRNPYGDGRAAGRIVALCLRALAKGDGRRRRARVG
jgi:UDP-N-acetylglucosamine 2-epimerase (non-hydrolysing)